MSGTFQHRVGVLAELPDLLRVLGVDPERTILARESSPSFCKLRNTDYPSVRILERGARLKHGWPDTGLLQRPAVESADL